jgi:hypothetical protein
MGPPPSRMEEESNNVFTRDEQHHLHIETQWVYIDPSQQLQGPFPGSRMQSWFESGFFPMTMRLKPDFEPNFRELGDYIHLFGDHFFCLHPHIFIESRMQPYVMSSAPPPPPPPPTLPYDTRQVPILSPPLDYPPSTILSTPSLVIEPTAAIADTFSTLLVQEEDVSQPPLPHVESSSLRDKIEESSMAIKHEEPKNKDIPFPSLIKTASQSIKSSGSKESRKPLSLPEDHNHHPPISSKINHNKSSTTSMVTEKEKLSIPSTASIVTEKEKLSIPSTASIVTEKEKLPIPSTASIVTEKEKLPIPSTASMVTEKEKLFIPSTASIITEKEKLSIPSTASIVTEKEKLSIPSTAAAPSKPWNITSSTKTSLPSLVEIQKLEMKQHHRLSSQEQQQLPPLPSSQQESSLPSSVLPPLSWATKRPSLEKKNPPKPLSLIDIQKEQAQNHSLSSSRIKERWDTMAPTPSSSTVPMRWSEIVSSSPPTFLPQQDPPILTRDISKSAITTSHQVTKGR